MICVLFFFFIYTQLPLDFFLYHEEQKKENTIVGETDEWNLLKLPDINAVEWYNLLVEKKLWLGDDDKDLNSPNIENIKEKEDINFNLIGIFHLAHQFNYVLIQDLKSKEINKYNILSELPDGSILLEIHHSSIIVRKDQQSRIIKLYDN